MWLQGLWNLSAYELVSIKLPGWRLWCPRILRDRKQVRGDRGRTQGQWAKERPC